MPEKNESIVFTDFSDKINDLFISKISNINDQVKKLKKINFRCNNNKFYYNFNPEYFNNNI